MFHHQQQAVVNYLNGAGNSNTKTKQHSSTAPPGFPQFPPFNMRIRGEPQVFVSVAYDFEYLAEDGKRVFMKENEILLLINKTNHDWWQVIRRGDKRPFYAPAKYVVELKDVPASVQAQALAAEMNNPHGNLNFSTFGPLKGKRSSYAPASGSSGVMLIPPPAASLESNGRLNDRYRSNSLDSILVADLDKQGHSIEHVQEMVAVHHHQSRPHASSATYHVYTQQHHFIPKNQLHQIRGHQNSSTKDSNSSLSGSLTKRPTFEALDKRKSWTLEQQQAAAAAGALLASSSATLASNSNEHAPGRPGSQQSRISAYQNSNAALSGNSTHILTSTKDHQQLNYDPRRKKPVPLPRSKIPVLLPGLEQQRRHPGDRGSRFSGLGPRSKTDLTAGGLANYKQRQSNNRSGNVFRDNFTALASLSSNKPVPQKRDSETGKKSSKKASKTKTSEDKPTFSTFKNTFQRTASLSDLINEDEEESLRKPVESVLSKRNKKHYQNNHVSNNLETSSLASVNVNIPDPILPLATKSITVQTDEVDLNLITKSDPLRISTEPLNGEGAELSLSTSFDSMDDSKSKSTDVSMEDALACSIKDADPDCDEEIEDLPTPPATPPAEERLKSPVSTTSRSPPSPTQAMTPTRKVAPEWEEYEDGSSGRKFYVNTATKERSWKPPRKSRTSETGSIAPTSPQPESKELKEPPIFSKDNETAEEFPPDPDFPVEQASEEVPTGYEKRTDADTGNSYYVNVFTGVRWFSAEDSNGKKYYYEENGNESCWALPNVSQSIQDHGESSANSTPEPSVKDLSPLVKNRTKTEILEQRHRLQHLPVSTPDFKIGNVNIVVLRQGPLHKTKLLENGKKQRKNWNVAHIVLTDTFLLFFKDAKTFANLQSGSTSKPDFSLDLKGAVAEWCSSDKSKRSNVFEVSTSLGTVVLLQDDSLSLACEWLQEIQKTIDALSSPLSRRTSEVDGTLTLPLKKSNKVGRTKSLKMKFLGSNEELLDENNTSPTGGATSNTNPITFSNGKNNNIREKLRKFFLRRPAMDDLFRRGIIKNEPVFGSTLRELQAQDLSDVPNFVKKCIECIEKGDLMKTDGVYRQSGNLSTIQKIRLQVDQGNLEIIDSVEDVHVLTGSLKLFFRELKEPLIPWEIVGKLLLAANHQSKKQKIKQIKDCVMSMPTPHRATLCSLLKHLVKVTQWKDRNRMQTPNLAIVFGPTLMWPPPHLVSVNLALDMMQQNIIVEALLNNVQNIFP